MKTLSQINKKANTLKNQLRRKTVVENFGDKEIRKFKDFVGDIYSYPYFDRLKVITIINDFESFCHNFTG